MKNKDLVFYAISALSMCLFVLLPVAAGFSLGDDFPGISFLQEWIKSGEQFVSSKN